MFGASPLDGSLMVCLKVVGTIASWLVSWLLVLGAPRKCSYALGWEAIGCATGDRGRIEE